MPEKLPSARVVVSWFVWMLFAVVLFALALSHDVNADESRPGLSFDPAAAQQVLDSVPGNTVAVYCDSTHSSCWLEVEVAAAAGDDTAGPEASRNGHSSFAGDDNNDGVIQEDESGWDCTTMGNRICGPVRP